MTAAQIRTDNGKWVAILLLVVALVVSVIFAVLQESKYECKEGGAATCRVEWESDEVPWYGAHPWAVPLIAVPVAGIVGWFIGVSIPVEPDRTAPPAPPSHCTQCGNPRRPGDTFCGNCGAALT